MSYLLNQFKLRIECYVLVEKDKQSSTATLGSQGINDMLQKLTNVAVLWSSTYGW
jgi:hypothetical protein